MAAPLLQLRNVTRRIGGRSLFTGLSFDVRPGDRVGLVGPNGAGKTTLLKLACGLERPDDGEIFTARSASVGLLRQEIDPASRTSVRDEAATALAHLDALEEELRALERQMADGAEGEIGETIAERYDAVSARFRALGGFERGARIDEVLQGLGFDAERRARPLAGFSGGWRMRVELAKLLLARPDVLLLDEPTNHLDLPSIQWFEETLAAFRGAVVTVSHDRSFLRRNARRIVELDGLGSCEVYETGYDRYLAMRAERREQLSARKARQDREIERTEKFVERFRAKATKARQAQSRLKALDKLERVELAPDDAPGLRLRIPEPPRAGEVVLRLEEVTKRFGDNTVYEGANLVLPRGERVALAGPNGAGKSTLLRMAAGALDPDEGRRALGHNVHCAYFAQHQLEALSASRNVLEELESVAELDDVPRLRGHLGAFLFTGDDVDKKVAVLSGGEKARLALAKLLLRPVNFLVLDEPTNHLDIRACEMLESALGAYTGTLLFVSHDRDFINALATRVVEVRDGGLLEFIGNYDEYLRRAEPHGRQGPVPAPAGAGERGDGAAESKAERIARREQERDRERTRKRVQRRLTELEASLEEREAALDALGCRLGDPDVYRDGERVRALESERTGVQASIDAGYTEWERLEAELAALGSPPESREERE